MSTKANAFANPVMAALETGVRRRFRAAGMDGPSAAGEFDDIHRTVAIIDAAADRIEADDLSAVAHALAGQALSLDVIFDQFARCSAKDGFLTHASMQIALRAQSQSCRTFKNLIALKKVRASPNSSDRTIESEKIPA